jgi:hypothetical protein
MALHSTESVETPLLPSSFETPHYIFAGFRSLVCRARQHGDLPSDFPQNLLIFSTLPQHGKVALNFMKVLGVDGTNGESLARGETKARSDLPVAVSFLQHFIPGFEHATFTYAAHQIGIRETRRILGEHVLTGTSVLQSDRFEDTVVVAYYPIDVHRPGGGTADIRNPKGAFSVPYRCLVPRDLDNILVAGRCVSCDRQAQGAIRVMALCMATGQAAGTAAALSLSENVKPRELDARFLRKTLRDQGAYLDP